MKILEICMSKGFGGLELYVEKTTRFLHESKSDYCVLTKRDSFLYKKLIDKNITVKSFVSVLHFLPLISAIKLARLINKNNIDILHVHWGNDLFFAVLGKIFSRRKVKLVYTRQMALTRKKTDSYHRFLYRNVDLYLTITKTLYDQAVKYLPLGQDKIRVLYYGVPAALDTDSHCHQYITDAGMDNDVFKLAIFGRIEKGKGQYLVVEAIKNLKSRGHQLQLAIIGHAMDKKYFAQLMDDIRESGVEENVFCLGFHNNPTSIMPCFNAVVLASKCETFGLVLPEAMRAGVAVLGSNCGGVPEIIQHEKTGLLFESENVADLTEQLLKLVSDKAFCEKLARAGKEEADERFSEEKHFAKLLELFRIA